MRGDKIYQLNAIKLAYVGDAVFSLIVRTYCVKNSNKKNSEINRIVNSIVCAEHQAKLWKKVSLNLTLDEKDITLRARNAHLNNKAKNSSFEEYYEATEFEALIGYLYLSDDKNRLDEILKDVYDELKDRV